MTKPKYVSIPDLAKKTGMPRNSLWRFIREYNIPTYKNKNKVTKTNKHYKTKGKMLFVNLNQQHPFCRSARLAYNLGKHIFYCISDLHPAMPCKTKTTTRRILLKSIVKVNRLDRNPFIYLTDLVEWYDN